MERSLSDLEHGPSIIAGCHFTVHNYTSDLASTSRTPAQELLNTGHKLIESANLQTAGWVTRKDSLLWPSRKSTTSYVFTAIPPSRVSGKGKEKESSLYEIKEWDAPVAEHEIFHLEDLEEFVNTDLRFLFVEPRPSTSQQHSGKFRLLERSLQVAEEPAAKRRKLDVGPLHGAIPQPHIHLSAFTTSLLPMKATPYAKTKPIFISPHTDPLPPSSEYARSSWLIPIRGILPWDHCTIATILDASHHIPMPATPTNDEITWTRGSVEAFWSFLIMLKNAGTVGSLGLSFHASPSYRLSSSSTYEPSTYADQYGEAGNRTASTNDSNVPAYMCRMALSSVDYIKVYHEAPKAMYVRTAFDAWSYAVTDGDGPTNVGGKPRKIRLLKGARLVLVDERSRGILVS